MTIQHQWCIKILFPKDPEFHTPLALNCQKAQPLSALEVYKNQSPIDTIGIAIPYSAIGGVAMLGL